MITVSLVMERAQQGEYAQTPTAIIGDALELYAEITPDAPDRALAFTLAGVCRAVEDKGTGKRIQEAIEANHGDLIREAMSRLWTVLAMNQTPEQVTRFHTTFEPDDDEWLSTLGPLRIGLMSETQRQALDERTITANRKIGRKTPLPADEVERITVARKEIFLAMGVSEEVLDQWQKTTPTMGPPYNAILAGRELNKYGIDCRKLFQDKNSWKLLTRMQDTVQAILGTLYAYSSLENVKIAIEKRADIFGTSPQKLNENLAFLHAKGVDTDMLCGTCPQILTYPVETLEKRIQTLIDLGFGMNCDRPTVMSFINFWPGILGTGDNKLNFLSQLGEYISSDPNADHSYEFKDLKQASIKPLGRLLLSLSGALESGMALSLADIVRRASTQPARALKDSDLDITTLHPAIPRSLVEAFKTYLLEKGKYSREPKDNHPSQS